jgi:hypothetical protein
MTELEQLYDTILYYDDSPATTRLMTPPVDPVAEALQVLRADVELLRRELHALQRERIAERDNLHG